MKSNNRGFTLIELLVVISIISMLASVVLVSLSSARNKAKDSSAIQSMVSMRNQAELVLAGNGSYPSTLCGSALLTLRQAVQKQVGGADLPTCNLGTGDKSWAVSTTLLSTATFCVDSTGYSGAGTAVNGSCGSGGGGPRGGSGSVSNVTATPGPMNSISGSFVASGVNNLSADLVLTSDMYGSSVSSGSISGSNYSVGGYGLPAGQYQVKVCGDDLVTGASICGRSSSFQIGMP